MTVSTPDIFDVRDRVAVITGGLGQLGRFYAGALAKRGARVVVLDQSDDPASLKLFPADVPADRIMLARANVIDRADLEAALARISERWGVPEVLVNNAAIDSPPNAPASENGPFETYPEESWDRVMNVNVKGVFLCCQVFGGAMAEAGRGSIVNIASIYGMVSPDQSLYQYRRDRGETFYKPVAYSASKSALYNLTRYLAAYWAGRGVRVNTMTLSGVFNNQEEAFLRAYNARMPMGRMATPEDFEGTLLLLASDASSYMTGANLVIDGGWTAI
jgi:NAD(P)-dependent dehydrogenase (short-subunit alcohol dehydrogenase family)